MMMMMMCLCCVCVSPSRAASLLRFFALSLSLYQKWIKRDISDFPDTNLSFAKRKKKHVILTPHRVDVVVVLQVLDFVVVSLVFVDDAMQIRRIGDR